jgi:hypothetical protein
LDVVGPEGIDDRFSAACLLIELEGGFDRVAGEVVDIVFQAGLVDGGAGGGDLEARLGVGCAFDADGNFRCRRSL